MLSSIADLSPKRILDIGANVGGFYYEAKSLWPEAQFVLVEGNPDCAEALEATGQEYHIVMLSDQRRQVDFYRLIGNPTATGNSYYLELTEYYSEGMYTVTQEQALPLRDLLVAESNFDFIKVDVQGAELDIIKGGLEIFKKAKHVLMEVSLKPYNLNAPTYENVINFMQGIGFVLNRQVGDIFYRGEIVQQDMLFLRENQ
jgi:FkbM family methyltransferase